MPQWPAISMDPSAVTTEAAVISIQMNPMAADDMKDVESSNKCDHNHEMNNVIIT